MSSRGFRLQTFALDTDGLSPAAVAEACRVILRALEGAAYRFETDVPITCSDSPPNVVAAAEVLRVVAAKGGRVERGGYAQTGLIDATRNEVWSAFVEFAPWAYDATVWDATWQDIAHFADEGHAIVVRLNHHQHDAISAALGRRPDLRLVRA